MSIKRTHLYVSPHFDDAVFSCAGLMRREIEQGIRVLVATVFSKGAAEHGLRSRENDKALALLGAESLELGFTDAFWRSSRHQSFEGIVLEQFAKEDHTLLADISNSLLNWCTDKKVSRIYAPLGVGHHIDHRLCFSAVERINWLDAIFYEDRPYALCGLAVEARLCELGIREMTQQEVDQMAGSVLAMEYVKEYLPADYRAEFEAKLRKHLTRIRAQMRAADPCMHSFGEHEYLCAVEAIYCYISQVGIFGGTKQRHRQLASEHAQRLGTQGPMVERYWSLKSADQQG